MVYKLTRYRFNIMNLENQVTPERSEREKGYDYELVSEEVPEGLKCKICHLISHDPVQVHGCCGCITCKSCIELHLRDNNTCPNCPKEGITWESDKNADRQIKSLNVHCENRRKGCDWTRELGDIEKHLEIKPNPQAPGSYKGCQYQEITCKKCDEKIVYIELHGHMENTCDYRVVECDFKFAGCDFQCPKIKMPEHIQGNTSKHLSCVAELMSSYNTEISHLRLRIQRVIFIFILCTISFCLLSAS